MIKLKEQDGWILYLHNSNMTAPVIEKLTTIAFMPLTADIFNTCPFKDYIFQGQDVLFIFVAGSSIMGLIDEGSDYDLKAYKTSMDSDLIIEGTTQYVNCSVIYAWGSGGMGCYITSNNNTLQDLYNYTYSNPYVLTLSESISQVVAKTNNGTKEYYPI